MSQYPLVYKKKVGAVIQKLKEQTWTWDAEESTVIKFLVDKGLAKFVGVESPPVMIVPVADLANQMQLQAANHYELSGLGEAFVQKYSKKHLASGRFLFFDEPPWHDRWPWKLVLPAIISLIVSLIVTIVGLHLGQKP
jgi:hypothetical protein